MSAVRASLVARVSAQRELVADRERVNGFLQDDCPGKEARLYRLRLLTAIDEEIPKTLADSEQILSVRTRMLNGMERLKAEHGFSEEIARWVVESWAIALGLGAQAGLPKMLDSDHRKRRRSPGRWLALAALVGFALIAAGIWKLGRSPHPLPTLAPGALACVASSDYLLGQHGLAVDLGKAKDSYMKAAAAGYFCKVQVPQSLLMPDDTNFDGPKHGAATDPRQFWELEGMAARGNSEAQGGMGNIFDSSLSYLPGTQVSDKISLIWYVEAAQGGNAVAACNASTDYIYGSGWFVDIGRARDLYRTATQLNYFCKIPVPTSLALPVAARSWTAVQTLASKANQDDGSFWKLEDAAVTGDAYAARLMGDLLSSDPTSTPSDPLPTNDKIALEWYQMGAEAGDTISACKASSDFLNGIGTATDMIKAMTMYKLTGDPLCSIPVPPSIALVGSSPTFAQISDLANNAGGSATEFWHLEGFAATGNNTAEGFFGNIFDGHMTTPFAKPVPANNRISLQWYISSARHGNSYSACDVSRAYTNGWGADIDPKLAAEWRDYATKLGPVCVP